MGRPKNMSNMFKSNVDNRQFTEGQKSKGILDDFPVRKAIATKEFESETGSIAGLNISNDGVKTTLLGKSGDYIRIGDGSTTAAQGALNSEDDLLVTGDLEVTNRAVFIGPANFWKAFNVFDFFGTQINFLDSSAAGAGKIRGMTNYTQFLFEMGASFGRQMVFGNYNEGGHNYDHALQTNPTLFIHSATNPDDDNTQWASLTHDQTDLVLATGSGDIKIVGANLKMDGGQVINTASPVSLLEGCKINYELAETNYVLLETQSDGDLNVTSNKASYNVDWNDANHSTTGDISATNVTGTTAVISNIFRGIPDDDEKITINVNGGMDFYCDGDLMWRMQNTTKGNQSIFNPTNLDLDYRIDTDLGNGIWYVDAGNNLMYFGDQGVTDYIEIDMTGDLVFNGGAGLCFADISVYDNGTADTIATGTWGQMTRFDTDGESNNCTPSHANDHITITKAGRYMVNVSASFSGDPNITWYGGVWKNNGNTQLQNLQIHRKLGAGGDVGCVSMGGIGDFAANDTVEIWIRQDSGASKDITIVDCCLSVVQIGGT